mmetsp:Transcript_4080/g.12295  ORF Transcript_4080/g.12295 Transcript_4080/m.12295 type:complete len:230 (+) Transcript_4080:994-1683(+)
MGRCANQVHRGLDVRLGRSDSPLRRPGLPTRALHRSGARCHAQKHRRRTASVAAIGARVEAGRARAFGDRVLPHRGAARRGVAAAAGALGHSGGRRVDRRGFGGLRGPGAGPRRGLPDLRVALRRHLGRLGVGGPGEPAAAREARRSARGVPGAQLGRRAGGRRPHAAAGGADAIRVEAAGADRGGRWPCLFGVGWPEGARRLHVAPGGPELLPARDSVQVGGHRVAVC